MRILHVIHRFPPAIGGSESWCAGLARWQAMRGHEVTVHTLRAVEEDELWDRACGPGPVAVGAADCDGGVRVRRCAVETPGATVQKLLHRRGLWPWTGALSAEFCGLLARLARANDVVHGHTVPLAHNYLAWLAARLAHRPFVLTPHLHAGHPDHEGRSVRWLLRRADRVLVVTESERAALSARGVAPGRLVVATIALDPVPREEAPTRESVRAALGVPPGAPLLSFVGRKAATKSVDVLFAALPLIRHRPAPVLAVAGPSTSWYRSLRPPSGAIRVIDLPVLSERAKTQLLGASDLFVLPSRHEAFGIVFLEAWAEGSPVLGADIPAIREAIGEAGTMFRPDDPVDLAAKIDAALADPVEARRQVVRGRQRIAAAHTWEHVGPTVEAAYEDVLARRRQGGPARGSALHDGQERVAAGR
jgi:glycosyltransferase involved in cell wall biosynthesis